MNTTGGTSTAGGATALQGLLCYCRAGFEPELAAELTFAAAEAGIGGYARTVRGEGFVVFAVGDGEAAAAAIPWRSLVFARQKLALIAELAGLDPRDRITPLLAALAHGGFRFGRLVVEHPDTDAAKPLAGLARAFANALRPALRGAGLLAPREDDAMPALHVCFVDGDHLFLASGTPGDSAPWPMGIPRLRMHRDAPSRSALKLEEALLCMLDEGERGARLRPGMRAADLGAAPGGWSWVLARHGLHVIAVDNGPMQAGLLETGQVDHVRADGFHWRPEQPLDWMVCDMVEQPRRVAARMGEWFREGWCRQAVFNLKLPMKKRWDETRHCLALFQEGAGRALDVRARQLFHDREEITVLALPR